MVLTDRQILNRWKNPRFVGAFGNAREFKKSLKKYLREDISYNRILKILSTNDYYLRIMRRKKIKKFRPFEANSFGDLVQADIGYFPISYRQKSSFLVCIDTFSRKVAAKAMRGEPNGKKVRKALQLCFDHLNVANVKTLITDGDTMFKVQRHSFFPGKNIRHHVLRNIPSKAALAENIIGIFKRKMFKQLRITNTINWPESLERCVSDYNKLRQTAIFNLSPGDFRSPRDEYKLQIAKTVFFRDAEGAEEKKEKKKNLDERTLKQQKRDITQRIRESKYNVGDKVKKFKNV